MKSPFSTPFWVMFLMSMIACTEEPSRSLRENLTPELNSQSNTELLFSADTSFHWQIFLSDTNRFQFSLERYAEVCIRASRDKNYMDWANGLIGLSKIHRELEKFDESETFLDSAKAIVENFLKKEDTLIAELYLESGQLKAQQGMYEEMKSDFEKAVNIRKESFGYIHSEVAESINYLADYYRATHEINRALSYRDSALLHLSGIEENSRELLADIYENIGLDYLRINELGSSAYFNKKALMLYRAELGENHPQLLSPLYYLGITNLREDEYDSAYYYYQESIDLISQFAPSPNPDLGLMYWSMGQVAEQENNFSLAEEFYLKSLEENEGYYGRNHEIVVYVYQRLGEVNSNMKGDGESKKDLLYQKEALDILLELDESNYSKIAQAYILVGRAMGELGFYEKGIVYSRRALNIYRNHLDQGDWSVSALIVLDNIGFFHDQMGKYQEAREIHEKHLELCLKLLGENHERTAFGYFHLGRDVFYLEEYDLAKEYFQKAKDIWSVTYSPDHHLIGFCTGFLASTELSKGNLEEALEIRKKDLEKYKSSNQMGSALNSIAYLHMRMENYEAALKVFQKALFATSGVDSINIFLNPRISDNYSDGFRLINSLSGKIRALSKIVEGLEGKEKEKNLTAILNTATNLKEWVEYIRLDYEPGKARSQITNLALNSYELAVSAASELSDLQQNSSHIEQVFAFFQARKSHSLLESTIEEKAKRFANIPTELLEENADLIKNLNQLKRKLNVEEFKQEGRDSIKIRELRDEVFILESTYDQFLMNLEKNYPKYYQFKYQVHTASLAEVQEQLIPDHKTAIVEYMLGKEFIYILGITKRETALVKIPHDSSMKNSLNNLKGFLVGNFMPQNEDPTTEIQRFAQTSHTLHKSLLGEVLSRLPSSENLNSLIIIPEGELGYIPFDILLTSLSEDSSKLSYSQLPYVINSFQISYGYSSTLLLETKPNKSQAKKMFAGFAPSYSKDLLWTEASEIENTYGNVRESLIPLFNNQPEVEEAANLMRGTSFKSASATETIFKREASNYKILHLAMHALTNDYDPMNSCLVFTEPSDLQAQINAEKSDTLGLKDSYTSGEDGRLYAHEIYSLSLKAELAVLSACNTGVGTLQRGEGIMSLARAFAYAGCPNIVMSLWQADDLATKEIMYSFYSHLREGEEKDQALRKAKLSYFKEGEFSHPRYWAGFVMIGNDAPISMSRFPSQLALVLFAVLIFSLGVYSYRRFLY